MEKTNDKKKKQGNPITKWIYRIVMVIAVCIFAYSAFQLGSIYFGRYQEKEETKELQHATKVVKKNGEEQLKDVDFEKLRKKNPDIIAWILVPGTDISYPIVQGKDNEYYLKHTISGNYNIAGSIFLDYEAASDFSDSNSFIYGHTMNHGTMFTNVKLFNNPAFAREHRYLYLFTPDKKYRCPIYSMYPTLADSDSYRMGRTTVANQESYLSMIKDLSTFDYGVEANAQSRIITLSTCSLEDGVINDKRFLLHAVLEEWSENDEQ